VGRWVLVCTAFFASSIGVFGLSGRAHPAPSAQRLWERPLRKPEFIITYNRQTVDDQLCLQIDHFPLWRLGDQAEGLDQTVTRFFQAQVDGQPLPAEHIQTHTYPTLTHRYLLLPRGLRAGTNTGPTVVCMDTRALPPGLHVADVPTRNRCGQEFSYQWAFEAR
jgi:hypothetical protein